MLRTVFWSENSCYTPHNKIVYYRVNYRNLQCKLYFEKLYNIRVHEFFFRTLFFSLHKLEVFSRRCALATTMYVLRRYNNLCKKTRFTHSDQNK